MTWDKTGITWGAKYHWDRPHINLVTLNPLKTSSALTLSNGNLSAAIATEQDASSMSTHSHSSGKWYAEMAFTSVPTAESMLGYCESDFDIETYPGAELGSAGKYSADLYYDGTDKSYGVSAVDGDVAGLALNLDDGFSFWSLGGVWAESGNPVTGANPALTGVSGEKFIVVNPYHNALVTVNFGATPFTYTIPAGYSAWNVSK